MNVVDVILAIVLAVFALRGYWRGFFRESFGLLALFGGIAAAIRFAAAGAELIEPYLSLPVVREGLSFVAIFVLCHGVITLLGVLFDRLASAASLGLANHAVGALVGVAKGAGLAAFVLLFLHLFPLVPTLDARLAESRLAPPLIAAAGNVVRFGLDTTPQPGGASQS
jgi:membrane protein required for colicin V production